MLDLIKGAAQAADTHLEELDPEAIRTDGGTQMRATINRETVEEYAQAMLAGDAFPPVIVYYDGSEHWLGDGFHRLAAWRQVMDDTIAAEVRAGTRRDAILLAAGANADHGLRRTNSDKRRAVLTLLQDDEWRDWSDREIARRCKVSNRFVTNLRAELQQAGQAPAPTVRKYTRNGEERTMETEKIGSARPLPTSLPKIRDAIEMAAAIEEHLRTAAGCKTPARLIGAARDLASHEDTPAAKATQRAAWAWITTRYHIDSTVPEERIREGALYLLGSLLDDRPEATPPEISDSDRRMAAAIAGKLDQIYHDATVNGSQYDLTETPETGAAPDPAPTSAPPPIAPPAPAQPAESTKLTLTARAFRDDGELKAYKFAEKAITITVSRRTLLAVYELVLSRPGRENLTAEARAEFEVRAEEALGMTGAPPPLRPAAMEEDLPDWRDLWDDAAEINQIEMGEYWEVDDITSPALCLRLIEEDDGDLSPALRRRYLALVE